MDGVFIMSKPSHWNHIILEGFCGRLWEYRNKHSKYIYGREGNENPEDRGKKPVRSYRVRVLESLPQKGGHTLKYLTTLSLIMVHKSIERLSGVPGVRTGSNEFNPANAAHGERALLDHEMEKLGKRNPRELVR